MAFRHVLLVALLAAGPHLPASVTTGLPCGEGSAASGLCVDAGGSGGSVDLTGSQEREGTDNGASPGGRDDVPGTSPGDGGGTGTGPGDPTAITDTLGTCQSDRCGSSGTPTITLTDLASFTPTPPTIHTEPDGWMLLGRPANAIADTTTHTTDGTLLDHHITVRFTPTTYHWDWGDNTHTTTTTPGTTWDDLGLPRFTQTPTSHTYTTRGPVTISLSIDHTVEYHLDDGTWTTITGTITSTTTLHALVVTGTTANVPHDCTTTPHATGC